MDKTFLIKAILEMDLLAKKYCYQTFCNDQRMKSVSEDDNCEWYHGGWLYCRLAEIVVSNDYLGESYTRFFYEHNTQSRIDILISGLADFAILGHVMKRVPSDLIPRTFITVVDICAAPLELCKWFIRQKSEYHLLEKQISYLKADATALPFDNHSYDMITSYSFLTRMVAPLMKKVISEWHRVLKINGEVLTTVHINSEYRDREGNFYRSDDSNIEFAMKKVDDFISSNMLESGFADSMHKKVFQYLENIMSVAITDMEIVKRLFGQYLCDIITFDQPGELEQIHKMIEVRAKRIDM